MSSFQALATAIAAQVGTGNIVGALRRDPRRRPGRHLLDVDHRLARHGDHLRRGRASPRRPAWSTRTAPSTAARFTTSRTAFKGSGSASSSPGSSPWPSFWPSASWAAWCSRNSIAETMNTAFGIPTWVMGLIVVILAGIVFIGGVSALRRRHREDRAHHGRPLRAGLARDPVS